MAASPNDTIIKAGGTADITDANGNVWSINNGQVALNGTIDPTTANVIEMAYENGTIWQENTSDLWWSKTSPSDTWGPAAGTSTNPIPPGNTSTPTTLTWIGGGNNNASNPADWSPSGVPQPGDALQMTNSGTINITGNDLAGDTLDLARQSPPPNAYTINLSDGTVSVSSGTSPLTTYKSNGLATLSLTSYFPTATLAIASGATLTYSGTSGYPYGLSIGGGPNATFVNNGTIAITGGVDATVGGNGTFSIINYHDGQSPTDFKDAVQAGVTIEMANANLGGRAIIDQPSQFHATVTAVPNSDDSLLLRGLSATSYAYQGDELTLYNQDAVVDQVKMLSQPTAVDLTTGSDAGVEVLFPNASVPLGGSQLPVYQPPANDHFRVADYTTGTVTDVPGSAYNGPVQGVQWQFIDITPDNLGITALSPNVFIHSGSGEDALDVSSTGGTNILDGSTGSNFMTGGSGNDTFYVDDRSPGGDIWTTIRNMHAGDNATVWGLTPQDFQITPADNVLPTSPGLNFAITGGPHDVNLTIPGYSTSDLSSGKLTVNYGRTQDLPGLPGSNYMQIIAH